MNLVAGKFVWLCLSLITLKLQEGPGYRIFNINGKEVKVTHISDPRFYGKYTGKAGGHLILNEDGTGEYLSDYFGYAQPACQPGPVRFRWGFLLDKNNEIVRFERDYGYSLPVVYESTGMNSFQGCRIKVFVDYLMVRPDGTIGVSSSDDWEKIH